MMAIIDDFPDIRRRMRGDPLDLTPWKAQGHFCCEECPGDNTCVHAAVCMCGDYMDHHASPMGCGHAPVSMHDYHTWKAKP
jgi:hypothetical protein